MDRSVERVTSGEAIEVLLDAGRRRLLEAFLGEPVGTAQAARRLGMKTNALYHHVRRFESLGLLKAVGRVVVDGHRVTRYEVSAEAFFFPLAAAPDASLAELLLRFTEESALAEHAAKALRAFSEEWGVLVERSGGDELTLVIAPEGSGGGPGGVRLVRLPGRDAPAFWGSGDVLQLDFETAKALQGELADLVGRYRERQVKGQQPYSVTLGLAAVQGDPS